jgi:hypothetical protein
MRTFIQYLFSITLILLVACGEEKEFSFTPAIGFEAPEGSVLETNIAGARVSLYSNTTFTETVTVTIAINNIGGLVYGDDYTMEPAPVDNTLTLTFDAENEAPAFFVYPTLKGIDRILSFTITEVTGSNLALAQQAALSHLFTIKSSGCPSGVQAVTVNHDFNGCTTDFAIPTGFIEVNEPGTKTDRGWGCRAFGVSNSRAPRASAFGGTAGEDRAWLIMNPIRIAVGASVSLTFSVASPNFAGPGVINVFWSNDYSGSGNPLTATWNSLSSIDSQFPAAQSVTFKTVSGTFTDICGDNVYLAFRYTGGTAAASAAWDIDNLSFVVQ